MQEDRRIGSAWWGMIALTAALVTGCGGDDRSELAKATDKARRLYDRSCALLRDAVYKVGDRYAPLTELAPEAGTDANVIGLAAPGELNPLADQAIQEGVQALSKALASPGDAPAREVVRARAVLARLHKLEGYRLSVLAAQKRAEAWQTLMDMERAAVRMADHGKRIANCDAILGVTDESLGAMADKAKADATAAQATIVGLKSQIQTLEKDKASLAAANEKLLGEARKLRVDSQLADVLKGIELFDVVLAKENEATVNSARITEIEDALQVLAGQVAAQEADVAAAQSRTAAAEKIASERQQSQADVREQRNGFVQLLTETQKEVETLAGEATQAGKATADLERQALAAYAQADEEYNKYTKATEGRADAPGLEADPVIVSLFGDVRMARGTMRAACLALQQRIDKVVGEVTGLWSGLPVQKDPPAVLGQIAGYLAEPAKVKEDAQNDFRWAAKDYERALSLVARKQQWVYQLQVAAACAALNGLAPDSDARQKGLAALDALGAEQGSPLIAPRASYLRKLLAEEGGAEPAPTPMP